MGGLRGEATSQNSGGCCQRNFVESRAVFTQNKLQADRGGAAEKSFLNVTGGRTFTYIGGAGWVGEIIVSGTVHVRGEIGTSITANMGGAGGEEYGAGGGGGY